MAINKQNKNLYYIFITAVVISAIVLSLHFVTPLLVKIVQADVWPTYTDNYYHFTIQYPPGWKKTENSFVDTQSGKVVNTILMEVVNQSLSSSYNQYEDPLARDSKTTLSENRSQADGKTIIKIASNTKYDKSVDNEYAILVDLGSNQTLVIYASANDKESMDYMVSTLHFNK